MDQPSVLAGLELDRASAVPIASQLEAHLRERIEQGDLAAGSRLPTEQELCDRLGVSRTTVRSALGPLVERGMLVRTPGRGTFVAPEAWAADHGVEELSVTVPNERRCWVLQQAAARWNAERPEQAVRLRFRIGGPGDLRSRLTLAVARGETSDISLVDSVWVAEFAERGYLEPFEEADPAVAAAVRADLVPPLVAQSTFRGQLFALPAEADFAVLWYRRDWFAAEGVAPPATWREWLAALAHFGQGAVRRRHAAGPFPLAFAGGAEAGEATTFQLLAVLWSAGAEVIADREVALASPEARQAVAFVADLVQRHGHAGLDVVTAAANGSALAFASGSVAMALGGTYEASLIRAVTGWDEAEFGGRVGFVPVPAGPHGAPATVLGGLSHVIYRQSRNPALAAALLRRSTEPALLVEAARRAAQNPATRSATAALEAETDPFLHATAALFPFARARWPIPEYARVSAQIARMFERAIVGEATPEAAVAEAAVVVAGITGLPERGRRRRPGRLPA